MACKKVSNDFRWAWFLTILACAIVPRAVGLNFGLPQDFHYDERTLIHRALSLPIHQWDPNYYWWPHLYFYLLAAAYAGLFVVGSITGGFEGTADFALSYYRDPTSFFLVARSLTCFFSVLIVFSVARITAHFGSWRSSVIAALSCSFSFLFVSQAHIAKIDTLMVCLSLFSLERSLKFWNSGRSKDAILSALLVGLATSAKFNALVLVPGQVLLHIYNRKKRTHA